MPLGKAKIKTDFEDKSPKETPVSDLTLHPYPILLYKYNKFEGMITAILKKSCFKVQAPKLTHIICRIIN